MRACCCFYVMYECVCRSNVTLLNLDLSMNSIKDEGAVSLAAALRFVVNPPDLFLVSVVAFPQIFDAVRVPITHYCRAASIDRCRGSTYRTPN
jgi:hypothetical protein